MKPTTKKRNRRGQAGGQGKNGTRKNTTDTHQFSPNPSKSQLSVDSLTRAAYLHGDLGLFYLARLPGIEHLPDPRFTPLFREALACFDREAELLKRAGDLEQREAGQ